MINFLRSIAIVGVILYHLWGLWFGGGFIGVDVFLVLSGFLITNSILSKYVQQGFHFGQWLRKRFLRIFPPLFFTLISIIGFSWFFSPDYRVSLGKDAGAAVSWTTNIYLAATGSSYMDQLNPNLFTHTWFLSLEMQFYLVWGLVMVMILGLVTRLSHNSVTLVRNAGIVVFFFASSLGLASYWLSYQMIESGSDHSLVYMMVYTHALPLMLGAAGAGIVQILKFRKDHKPISEPISNQQSGRTFSRALSAAAQSATSSTATTLSAATAPAAAQSATPLSVTTQSTTPLSAATASALLLSSAAPATTSFSATSLSAATQSATPLSSAETAPATPTGTLIPSATSPSAAAQSATPFSPAAPAAPSTPAAATPPATTNSRGKLPSAILGILIFSAGFLGLELASDLHQDFYFIYGQFLIGILTVAVLVVFWFKPFKIPVTDWIGTRSFGLYLFHYPLFHITENWWLTLLLSSAMAEINYRLFEQSSVSKLVTFLKFSRRTLVAGLTVVSVFVLATAPAMSATETQIMAQTRQNDLSRVVNSMANVADAKYIAPVIDNAQPELWPDSPSEAAKSAEEKAAAAKEKALEASRSADLATAPAVIIGDSVCLNAAAEIALAIPGIYIDCEVSRFALTGLDIVKRLKKSDRLPPTVIIQLATNVIPQSYDAMPEIVKQIGKDHKIILVTGFGRGSQYDYMGVFAEVLRNLAAENPNVKIADWAALISKKQDWLSTDGFHPGNDQARQMLADEILRAYNS